MAQKYMSGTNLFTPYGGTIETALTDDSGNAILIKCAAASLPTGSGYAIGCIGLATDTGAFYTNTGTASVASFTLISASSVTIPSALTDSSTTTGNSLSSTLSAITTGKGINVINGNTTNFVAGAALIQADMGAAVAGNGVVAKTTAAYTGTGVIYASAGAMATGVLMQLTSTTGLTSGSLLAATTSTAGALTNGAVAITGTGAHTSTSNAGLLNVSSSATVTGTVVNIAATAASQTATTLLNCVQSGATLTAFTGSLVSLTGGFSGTSSTGNILGITAVNTTAGDAVLIASNALTLGAATIVNLTHTTTILGAGTSMMRIKSTGVNTGTTTGVLLDLQTTAAAGSTQLMVNDSSADTAARIGILSKVTNAAAVLAVPIKTSNVAVVNSKFTKHIVMTDGTKVTTIWLSQDATDPNGTLTGVAGDLCLNGPSNKPYYCTTSGTTWATVV